MDVDLRYKSPVVNHWNDHSQVSAGYLTPVIFFYKMKLALVFLSVFLFASCAQQRQNKRLPWPLVMPMSYYYSPRAFYQWQNPFFLDEAGLDFSDPSPSLDWEEPGQTLQPEEDRAKNSQDSTKPLDSTQSRSANRFRPNSFNLAQLNPAQQRLFFGALNPFNSNTNNWFGNLLQTSTLVTVTVPSTLVTAIISTCIPSGQFLAGSAAIPCVRRRRQIAGEIEDQLDQAQVSPTLVQQVEPTAIPTDSIDRERRQADFQQQIISSKEDVDFPDADSNAQRMILQRQNRAVTFTTTMTTYVFSSTIVKKTLNLAIPLGLSCLPVGFLAC